MADTVTLEDVEALAAKLTLTDRKRLAENLLGDLLQRIHATDESTWEQIRGIAPGLLQGEDAQAWVSRTRRESDDHRDLL